MGWSFSCNDTGRKPILNDRHPLLKEREVADYRMFRDIRNYEESCKT